MKHNRNKSKLEGKIDKIYAKLILLTKVVGFGILPISFIFKYFNVTGVSIVFLLSMGIIAIVHGLYKAFLYPESFNILSPDMPSYKPQSSNPQIPSTTGAIASDL